MFDYGKRVFNFYRQGFQSMVLGRLLWKVILIKLVLLYTLAKFFFPDYLQTNFSTDAARADHVLSTLTEQPGNR